MHPVLRAWLLGMRPWSLPISIVPIVLSAVIVYVDPYPEIDACPSRDTLYAWEFVACLVGGMSIHAGANLINTYVDFKYGVDTSKDADDRTLVDKTMRPNEVRGLGIALFVAATAIAFALARSVGNDLWIVYAIGASLAFFYTADPFSLKYNGLGDLTVFLCFGPLLMTGVSTALGCGTNKVVLLMSVPFGLLTEGVLHANNVRDIEADRRVGVRTLAQLVSPAANATWYGVCVLSPFLLVLLMVAQQHHSSDPGFRPLAVFATIPWASYLLRSINAQTKDTLAELPQRTAQFALMFGVVLIGSLSTPLFFGRFLLGQLFYLGGVNNILQWKYNAALVHMKLNNVVSLPRALTTAAFLFAVLMQLLSSVTFVLGLHARLSACVLLVFLVPVTFFVHDMWIIRDETTPPRPRRVPNAHEYTIVRRHLANFPTEFDNEFVHFFKNAQIMGGLVLYLALTEREDGELI